MRSRRRSIQSRLESFKPRRCGDLSSLGVLGLSLLAAFGQMRTNADACVRCMAPEPLKGTFSRFDESR